MNQWSWNITQNIKTQHTIPLEILHPQDTLHYAAHTQQADREHYSWPYVTRRPGFLKSLPVSAASVLELCEVMVQNISDSPSFLEWCTADRARNLFELFSHSFNVLWGANCFNTTTFLLNSWAGLFKVVYPRLYGMSWRHFTVSMNPKFLAKFTLGGNIAIVVLIKWF